MYEFYKKILTIFVLISLPLISYSQQTIEVQLVSISNVYNNHVGNEWSHNVTVNQKTLNRYKNLSFKLIETNTLTFKVNCSEYDEKYSD